MTVSQAHVRCYWRPKAGNSDDEYEDAYKWRRMRKTANQRFSAYAVADGATESSFSREWAELLVREYVKNPFDPKTLEARLQPLQKTWADDVFRRPLKYYARNKARAGAFAAIVGLTLEQVDSVRSWHGLAVGDSCLFHFRGDELLACFPIEDWRDFGNAPLLLSSRPESNEQVWTANAIKQAQGSWDPGDSFLLMSDALACWFLTNLPDSLVTLRHGLELQADKKPPQWRSQFARLVDALRVDHTLRNDDVTLLAVLTQAPKQGYQGDATHLS